MTTWCVRVKPLTTGFHRGMQRVGADKAGEADGAGEPFLLGPSALKYDKEGRIEVDKKTGLPLLPRWVEPLGEIPKLPEGTPTVPVDTEAQKAGRRKRPQLVMADRPVPFEARMRRTRGPVNPEILKQMEMEENERPARPARPAAGGKA